jgi:hypothetical protein
MVSTLLTVTVVSAGGGRSSGRGTYSNSSAIDPAAVGHATCPSTHRHAPTSTNPAPARDTRSAGAPAAAPPYFSDESVFREFNQSRRALAEAGCSSVLSRTEDAEPRDEREAGDGNPAQNGRLF